MGDTGRHTREIGTRNEICTQRFVRQSNIIFLFQLGGNNVQFYCIRVSLCVHLGLCSVHARKEAQK